MPRISSRWRLALAVSGLALVAACSPNRPVNQSAYTAPGPTNASEPTPVSGPGNVLTTPSGMTVYVYDRDSAGHSTCYDACAAYWPPVYAPAGAAPVGGLTLVQRGDGRMQWATSQGMPLYTFVDDRTPPVKRRVNEAARYRPLRHPRLPAGAMSARQPSQRPALACAIGARRH